MDPHDIAQHTQPTATNNINTRPLDLHIYKWCEAKLFTTFFLSFSYCGDWVHTAVMMRLPNPLDVRGENSLRSMTFVQGNSRWVSPGKSRAKKKSMKPTGNPKKYLECDVTRSG